MFSFGHPANAHRCRYSLYEYGRWSRGLCGDDLLPIVPAGNYAYVMLDRESPSWNERRSDQETVVVVTEAHRLCEWCAAICRRGVARVN